MGHTTWRNYPSASAIALATEAGTAAVPPATETLFTFEACSLSSESVGADAESAIRSTLALRPHTAAAARASAKPAPVATTGLDQPSPWAAAQEATAALVA